MKDSKLDKLTELSVKLFAVKEIRKDLENDIYAIEHEITGMVKNMLRQTRIPTEILPSEVNDICDYTPLKQKKDTLEKIKNKISQIKSELYTLLEL